MWSPASCQSWSKGRNGATTQTTVPCPHRAGVVVTRGRGESLVMHLPCQECAQEVLLPVLVGLPLENVPPALCRAPGAMWMPAHHPHPSHDGHPRGMIGGPQSLSGGGRGRWSQSRF